MLTFIPLYSPFKTSRGREWFVTHRKQSKNIVRNVRYVCKATLSADLAGAGSTIADKYTPVHPRIPYLSLLWESIRSRELNLELRDRYGDVYRTAFPHEVVVFVTRHDLVKAVLEDEDVFRTKGSLTPAYRMLFGDDNFNTMFGQILKFERREAVRALFCEKTMPRYFDGAKSGAERLVDKLLVACENGKLSNGKGFDVLEEAGRLAMRVVFLGMDSTKDMYDQEVWKRNDRVFNLMRRIELAVHFPPVWPIKDRGLSAQREIQNLFTEELNQRIPGARDSLKTWLNEQHTFEEKKYEYADFLSYLVTVAFRMNPEILDMGNDVISVKVTRLMTLLLFGGYTTTGPMLAMTIFKVYSDPALLQTLREEQKRIMKKTKLTLKSVRDDMPILTAVTNEVTRLWPSISALSRRCIEDTVLGGHKIRKGERVMLDVWSAQTQESKFDNPFTFDYTRFMQSGENEQHYRATTKDLMLFSSTQGPHYCLGAPLARMEVVTVMAVLIRNVDLQLNVNNLDKGLICGTSILPKEGIFVKNVRRYNIEDDATLF